MRISRLHCSVGVLFVLGFFLMDWLVVGESSPLNAYLLNHVSVPNFWRTLHMMPYIAGMVLSRNVHQPNPVGYLAAAAVQWFIIGFLVSFFIQGMREDRRRKAGLNAASP